MFVIALLVLVYFNCVLCSVVPDEDWGYVTVRDNANLFWWLYGRSDSLKRDASPLVVWLQGGPGASGTGFGNFEEIGPLDVNLQPRPINWVQSANIMFIDSPVGTGYSYTTSDDAYCTTDEQVGIDLVVLLQHFLEKYPLFKANPFWIFCESYGGKEATSFGVAVVQAIQKGTLNVNFKGVALGDSWISPVDFVLAYTDYLLSVSEIDNLGYEIVNKTAHDVLNAVTASKWDEATSLWSDNQNAIGSATVGINFYNILDRSSSDYLKQPSSRWFKPHAHLNKYYQDPLTDLMNGKIRQKLNIPQNVTWGGQSGEVFTKMTGVFMKPYVEQVDFLLVHGFQVVVYSGNLDLICCTPGTLTWMSKLKWPGYSQFEKSPRNSFVANSLIAGFSKTYQNLSFFTILSAGHMVPADQPSAAKYMLDTVIA
eukprot:TRINITY_DN16288_c0_g1_i1.p1 TRINITY_DN16288_c0_g1~~TRINITY_DN16288_c0_g1_i1.p1  ORF type:complete len:425 (-),score=71.35 TRINITY_DN16288_c0_g1_i1:18-1292(-)